jgi:hypothetical protein
MTIQNLTKEVRRFTAANRRVLAELALLAGGNVESFTSAICETPMLAADDRLAREIQQWGVLAVSAAILVSLQS